MARLIGKPDGTFRLLRPFLGNLQFTPGNTGYSNEQGGLCPAGFGEDCENMLNDGYSAILSPDGVENYPKILFSHYVDCHIGKDAEELDDLDFCAVINKAIPRCEREEEVSGAKNPAFIKGLTDVLVQMKKRLKDRMPKPQPRTRKILDLSTVSQVLSHPSLACNHIISFRDMADALLFLMEKEAVVGVKTNDNVLYQTIGDAAQASELDDDGEIKEHKLPKAIQTLLGIQGRVLALRENNGREDSSDDDDGSEPKEDTYNDAQLMFIALAEEASPSPDTMDKGLMSTCLTFLVDNKSPENIVSTLKYYFEECAGKGLSTPMASGRESPVVFESSPAMQKPFAKNMFSALVRSQSENATDNSGKPPLSGRKYRKKRGSNASSKTPNKKAKETLIVGMSLNTPGSGHRDGTTKQASIDSKNGNNNSTVANSAVLGEVTTTPKDTNTRGGGQPGSGTSIDTSNPGSNHNNNTPSNTSTAMLQEPDNITTTPKDKGTKASKKNSDKNASTSKKRKAASITTSSNKDPPSDTTTATLQEPDNITTTPKDKGTKGSKKNSDKKASTSKKRKAASITTSSNKDPPSVRRSKRNRKEKEPTAEELKKQEEDDEMSYASGQPSSDDEPSDYHGEA